MSINIPSPARPLQVTRPTPPPPAASHSTHHCLPDAKRKHTPRHSASPSSPATRAPVVPRRGPVVEQHSCQAGAQRKQSACHLRGTHRRKMMVPCWLV
eukprot:9869369-Alexandrium_andersonii.AAC.1